MAKIFTMAEDIRALELLRNEYAALQGLPDPPRDIDKIEAFETAWSQQLGLTQSLFDEISTYTEAIYGEAEELRNLLNNSTTEVQQCLLELIDSLKCKFTLVCRKDLFVVVFLLFVYIPSCTDNMHFLHQV